MAKFKQPSNNNLFDQSLSPEDDAKVVEKYRNDPVAFIQTFLQIRVKSEDPDDPGVLKPFKLNFCQRWFVQKFMERLNAGLPLYFIVLKARKIGISTLVEALLYWRVRLWPESEALIIGNSNETAETVLDMTQIFHDECPEEIRPMVGRRTKSLLRYENPKEQYRGNIPGLRSQVRIATAKNADVGRSKTLRAVHLTEVAYFREAYEVFNSVMNAVPEKDPTCIVVIESTPNGMDNFYYDFWQRSKPSKDGEPGRTGFEPIFLPFWMDPELEIPVAKKDEEAFRKSLTAEEKKMMADFPAITLAKINWYRWALDNKCQSSTILLHREYPYDDESAFKARGQTIFDLNALNFYFAMCKPGQRGILVKDRRGKPHFVPDASGPILRWVPPVHGMLYCGGVDTGLGIPEENRPTDVYSFANGGDYSVMVVLSVMREQVAELVTNALEPSDFADLCMLLGYYYHTAMIMPEVGNQVGIATQYRLKARSYPRLGLYEKFDHLHKNKLLQYIGIEPNTKTVGVMNMVLQREFRRGAGLIAPEFCPEDKELPRMRIYSKDLMKETLTYGIQNNGSISASYGSHDDKVRALQLALIGLEQLPSPKSLSHRNHESSRSTLSHLPNLSRTGEPMWMFH